MRARTGICELVQAAVPRRRGGVPTTPPPPPPSSTRRALLFPSLADARNRHQGMRHVCVDRRQGDRAASQLRQLLGLQRRGRGEEEALPWCPPGCGRWALGQGLRELRESNGAWGPRAARALCPARPAPIRRADDRRLHVPACVLTLVGPVAGRVRETGEEQPTESPQITSAGKPQMMCKKIVKVKRMFPFLRFITRHL